MQIDHVACHYRKDAGISLSRWSLTQYHIFILVTKGRFLYRVGDDILHISKGEGLFIPQHSMRTGQTDSTPGPHQMFITYFKDLPLSDLAPLLDEPFKHFHFSGHYDYLQQRFSVLNEYWIGKPAGYHLVSRGIIMEIIGILHHELAGGAFSSSHRNLALLVQQYIVQHYREPIRLNELAEVVERSPAYVSTVFKKVMGRTPMEYMHEVRVSAARELILNTNLTIEEIAELLGYCNQTYFTQRYKKIMGHPPTHTLKLEKQESYIVKEANNGQCDRG